ncbi:MAG: hypothetical protein PG981_000251 [Wolbachia endosymbiont of Ctenocephalides orientis wCori]|nr:MAG: hypothetical protein PG981_000251 [Wolbachia endosymbiont of Ctenocephalides orientis wCori]
MVSLGMIKGIIVSTNGSDITAKENKKHYNFTGQELCEVDVNWQINRNMVQNRKAHLSACL